MKALRKLAVLSAGALSLMSMTAALPAAFTVSAEEKAETGTWSFDEDAGTLTISGEWDDFYSKERPWESLREARRKPAHTVIFKDMKIIPAFVLDGFRHVKKIVVPEGTEVISEHAFSGCSVLEEISLPDSLLSVEYSAFSQCISLGTIVIPEKVTTLQGSAFEGCTALRKITLSDQIDEIGSDVFKETLWLDDRRAENPLVAVNGIIIDGKKCKGAVQIPDGTRMICSGAFRENGEITEITLPDSLTFIGGFAFNECHALETVVIPKQVREIGDYAFFICNSLKSVVMEEGVTVIGSGAFASCNKLEDITIPKTVNRIETYALSNTKWMENQQKENPLVIVNNILVNATACKGDVVIPDDIVLISPYAFERSGIKSVTIPEGIREIPFCAFSQCEYLTSVTIPDTVTRIDSSAFANCDRLKEITIPASVKVLEYTVFSDTDLTIRGYTGSAAEAYAKQYEIPFTAIGSAAPEHAEALCGDANSDGTFDIADAVLTARYIIADKSAFITDTGRLNADVNGDGAIQPEDVTVMLQRIARKILVFPAEEKNEA